MSGAGIPAEAVEAAAKALWPGGTSEQHRLRNVRKALEAAAPHLLAQGWDECAQWPSRPTPDQNPYRTNE